MQDSLFNLENHYASKWYIFKNTTELGKLYDTIPWSTLISLLPTKKSLRGTPSWLKPQGYFGLMFLKHYTGLSDEKLLEHFHTDYAMQLFCGVLLQDNERIRNNAFVSHVRSFLAQWVDLQQVQKTLITHWKSNHDIDNEQVLLLDATCFESYIRYPTDVKLLWECIEKLHTKLIPHCCKANGLKIPKTAFKDKRKKYLSYSKRRKKGYRISLSMRKTLIVFLQKTLDLFGELQQQKEGFRIETKHSNIFTTIKTILSQQKQLLEQPKEKVENRIVSLHKPYLRPIVRGKENKPVEFGMKVNRCQTGGINWIEHQSFSAFNEANRLEKSVLTHESIFGACTQLGADNIYPTNANRTFISQKGISTNFPKKGRKVSDMQGAKTEKKQSKALGKLRSTVLEGSFGNIKNHYLLRKIKALNEKTELVWVFFGVLTANVVAISNKRTARKAKKEEANQYRHYKSRKAA